MSTRTLKGRVRTLSIALLPSIFYYAIAAAESFILNQEQTCFCDYEKAFHPETPFCENQCREYSQIRPSSKLQKASIQVLIPVSLKTETSNALPDRFQAPDLQTYMGMVNKTSFKNDIKIKLVYPFNNLETASNPNFLFQFKLLDSSSLIYLKIPAALLSEKLSLELTNTTTQESWPEISFDLSSALSKKFDSLGPISEDALVNLYSKYSAYWQLSPTPKLLNRLSKTHFTLGHHPLENLVNHILNFPIAGQSHDLGWRPPNRMGEINVSEFLNHFPKVDGKIDSTTTLTHQKFETNLIAPLKAVQMQILQNLENPWGKSSPSESFATLSLPIAYKFKVPNPQLTNPEISAREISSTSELSTPEGAIEYPVGSILRPHQGSCPKSPIKIETHYGQIDANWKLIYQAVPTIKIAGIEILSEKALPGKIYQKIKGKKKFYQSLEFKEEGQKTKLFISIGNVEYQIKRLGCVPEMAH
jgi:hypothetical protein